MRSAREVAAELTTDVADAELVVETEPGHDDIRALEDGIYAFNVERTGSDDGELIGIFLRGEGGAIRAGLYGWTWSGCLEVRYLWVHESLRNQGIGSRLLTQAEQTARDRGCQLALLDTHSFQAPEFYRRHGYEEYAVLDGYPAGHQKVMFRKRLLGEG